MSVINSDAINVNHHFPTKYPQLPRLYISRKIRPFQLSQRVKDYLPKETALHSLLLRYRLSTSLHIIRPRTQSLRFADTSERSSVHFRCRITSPRFWLGPIFLYPSILIADSLASGTISHDWPNLPLKSAVRSDDWCASARLSGPS